ncbi:DUF3558 domain-containing protein [Amycolatopsis jiangsuensis]|uniref:DUF3558 domain-containing protein n=1 Tax=Amycolatopsis jiangsuensis TaxID=1181879 RepID=A0A840IRU6_9PSEU|nr:DUF3558 domain-containing protein [Amycolatopsis jiangsuensis]MBB4685311.1 hypothetical protein [Amycolatopsis jiangsuensis]
MLLLTGCSSTTPGTATSAPTMSSSVPAKPSAPYGGAPKVEHPLPDTVLSGDPCEALTPQQLTYWLGSAVPGKPGKAIDRLCNWTNSNTGSFIGVSFDGKNSDGLSNTYAVVRPQMKRFEALPLVQGFPAVAYDKQPGPYSMSCDVDVGVTDHLAFSVEAFPRRDKSGKVDPCPLAAQVAGDVVTTLKQKAGR